MRGFDVDVEKELKGFRIITVSEYCEECEEWEKEFRNEFGKDLYCREEEVMEEPPSYLDYLSVCTMENVEIIGIVEAILEADSQEERDEIINLCAEGSYPELFDMLAIAGRAIMKREDFDGATKFGQALRENFPQLMGRLYDVLSA